MLFSVRCSRSFIFTLRFALARKHKRDATKNEPKPNDRVPLRLQMWWREWRCMYIVYSVHPRWSCCCRRCDSSEKEKQNIKLESSKWKSFDANAPHTEPATTTKTLRRRDLAKLCLCVPCICTRNAVAILGWIKTSNRSHANEMNEIMRTRLWFSSFFFSASSHYFRITNRARASFAEMNLLFLREVLYFLLLLELRNNFAMAYRIYSVWRWLGAMVHWNWDFLLRLRARK